MKPVTTTNLDAIVKDDIEKIEQVSSFNTAQIRGFNVSINGNRKVSLFIALDDVNYDAVSDIVYAQLLADRTAAQVELASLGMTDAITDEADPSLYTNTNTFFSPMMGQGPISPLLTNTSTFYAPTVVRA